MLALHEPDLLWSKRRIQGCLFCCSFHSIPLVLKHPNASISQGAGKTRPIQALSTVRAQRRIFGGSPLYKAGRYGDISFIEQKALTLCLLPSAIEFGEGINSPLEKLSLSWCRKKRKDFPVLLYATIQCKAWSSLFCSSLISKQYHCVCGICHCEL